MIPEYYYNLRETYKKSCLKNESIVDSYLDKLIPLYENLRNVEKGNFSEGALMALNAAIDFNKYQINFAQNEIGLLEKEIDKIDEDIMKILD